MATQFEHLINEHRTTTDESAFAAEAPSLREKEVITKYKDEPDVASAIDRMETVLLAAGGGSKISVTSAKAALRAQGCAGRALAARISRLSKAWNWAAHPDSTLADEVAQLLASLCEEGKLEHDIRSELPVLLSRGTVTKLESFTQSLYKSAAHRMQPGLATEKSQVRILSKPVICFETIT